MSVYYAESNRESTKALFEKRTIYGSDVRNSITGYTNLVNFNFAEKYFYGRVNQFFVPIVPSPLVFPMKSFKGQTQGFKAFNFVVDAFDDLSLQFQRCAATGQISADDPFLSNLVVYKAFNSPVGLYGQHLTNYYNAVINQFRTNEIKVKNFTEFIREFERLVSASAPEFPFTEPGYIKSRLCPISVSGIAIEIAEMDYANDEEKINQFVNSPNWEFYVNACRSYGFMVDKFVPWRLVADIGSPTMIEYASKYCTGLKTLNQVLNLAYDRSHISFFDRFKFFLYDLYNKAKLKSFLEISDCNGRAVSTKIVPQTYSLEEFSALYSETYFLELYLRLRLIEEEDQMKDFENSMLIDDTIELYVGSGLTAALNAFERVNNKTFDYRGSLSYTKEYIEARNALEKT